jgi:hypothetical protein
MLAVLRQTAWETHKADGGGEGGDRSTRERAGAEKELTCGLEDPGDEFSVKGLTWLRGQSW